MTDTAAQTPTRGRYAGWPRLAIAIVFGLFYAYDLWEGVGNLLGLASISIQYSVSIRPAAWFVIGLGIAVPILIFVVATLLGRRHGYLTQAALYLAGLCASAATALSLTTASAYV